MPSKQVVQRVPHQQRGKNMASKRIEKEPTYIVDHSDVRDSNSPDSGTSSQASSDLVNSMESMTISFPPKCVTPVALTSEPPQGWVSFTFEIHQSHVGWMIGGKGSFISKVREKSGCHVQVIRQPMSKTMKLCVICGPTEEAVGNAKIMIRERFPRSRFPKFRMNEYKEEIPVINSTVVVPNVVHLTLPVGVTFNVVVSALATPENIFLQQITHPSFHHLNVLGATMDEIYGGNSQGEPPALVKPLSAGILCAAQSDGHWFRCQIVEVMDDDSEEIALLDLDYGGYYTVATSTCRQIRADLLNYPFQAAEARLANIMPINGMTYQTEALPAVEEMLMGTVLTATVVGFHAIDMRPCVELQLDQGDGTLINLNREMCARGLARWIE